MDNALLDLRYSSKGEIVNFYDLNEKKQLDANKTINKVVKVVSDAYGAKAVADSKKKNIKYVVNMSDKIKKGIEDGNIILDTNKYGETYAQVRENGKWAGKFTISKETTGLDPLEVSQALQQKAIAKQLKEISSVIDDINYEVLEVIQGQQNDRLALFYSGIELYLEAQNVNDEALRKLLIAQSLKSISDGGSQILENARCEIDYLVSKKYNEETGKGARIKAMDTHMENLNYSFQAVNYAYLAKACIYYENNEFQSMLLALEEYNKFLSNDIIPNVDDLIECDRNDILLSDGKWEKRSKQFKNISDIRQQICNNTAFCIELPEGKKK